MMWMNEAAGDWLWGIERDPLSPENGNLVCPLINLFEHPVRNKDGTGRGASLGMGLHSDEVEILEVKRGAEGRNYYQIKIVRNGSVGWVSEPFLKEAGA